jgi:hypothetical protein
MKKFILLYNGPATRVEDMDPAKVKEIMGMWAAWMGRLGDAMVDFGQPMDNGESVVDDGSEGKALELSGYSIIQAEDMDGAKKLVDGHPFLSDKTGKFSVEIFELLPVPGM